MERPAAARAGGADPLAELARLVGHDDPFRNMFKPAAAPARPAAREPAPDVAQEPAWSNPKAATTEHYDADLPQASEHGADEWAGPDAHDEPYAEPVYAEGTHHGQPEAPVHDYATEGEHQAYEEFTAAPDLWAEPSATGLSDESAAPPPTPRRPLVVLFAVLALTGGGLAATFLARTGPSVAATSGAGAPVILASTTPDKIKQADVSNTTNAEDADAALLSRNGETNGGPVKVVNSQEQPIDLAQLPKAESAPASSAEAPQANSQSPFPEPRMVKTFLVRPDGTMIPTGTAGALAPQGLSSLPQMAALPPVAAGGGTPVAALPATPKTGVHAATTPKAAPPTIGELAGDPTNSVSAKPAAPETQSQPVVVADAAASDGATAPQGAGGFALQLAASPSERDARAAFARLEKKYTELGSYQPRIKKAGTAGRPVYRLRVGSMSKEQAKTLCAQLQAGGGSCFVVRD
ncbi:MAG TPA: SPOR domain-containing protein [Lichenihabitans sp.]|nr:SPOR domain-containing protein [Lichenihabitans sp.]